MSDPAAALELAHESLARGDTVQLAAVVDRIGSAPGAVGSLMAVTPTAAAGTVGGGAMEHDLVERLRSGEHGVMRWDHGDPSSGSECSGVQVLAVRQLAKADLAAVAAARDTLVRGGCGGLVLSSVGLELQPVAPTTATLETSADGWRSVIPIGVTETLTICGGGHVSRALSRVVATLPFRIVVLDHRADLPTLESNRWAHERRQVDWADVARHVPEGHSSWAVIMTSGHVHDEEVLQQLLRLDLRYLGLMGSRAKVTTLFSRLESRGVSPADLGRVHAPVGLPIASRTPEEIAISIAAELVAERRRG